MDYKIFAYILYILSPVLNSHIRMALSRPSLS